nr:hypothetical protein [uncultured Campylobacter sp.]
MMKFKSRYARTKFKFKNKSATRVKFRAHGAYKSLTLKGHLLGRMSQRTSSASSARTSSSAKILATRSCIVS